MNTLFYYSGLLAILAVWLLAVIPSIFAHLNLQKDPISYTVFRKRLGRAFNLGLVTTSLLQIMFMFFLVDYFALEIMPLGGVLYILSLMFLLIAGFITEGKTHLIHATLAKLYVVLTLSGELLFSLETGLRAIFVLLPILGGLLALTVYYKTKSRAWPEYIVILFSSLWVLSFYLIVII